MIAMRFLDGVSRNDASREHSELVGGLSDHDHRRSSPRNAGWPELGKVTLGLKGYEL